MTLNGILSGMMTINRDNGKHFTDTGRLDNIAVILADTPFRKLYEGKLVHLYGQKPLTEIKEPVILVSSHVDCERRITKCFFHGETLTPPVLRGTFDNAATNAACMCVMQNHPLPENVLFAFTGDEEEDSGGCLETVSFLKENGISVKIAIVTDVTDMSYGHSDLTVENNFWDDATGKAVIDIVSKANCRWMFVPSDPDDLPSFVPSDHIIPEEAEADESWDYDEEDIPVFSFCVPVSGDMHSDIGCLMDFNGFQIYIETLASLLCGL